MRYKYLILTFCIAAIIAGCDNKYRFEAKHDIPNAQWTYRDTFDFPFQIQDTSTLYNIYLNLGTNTAFASQNLYVRMFTAFPDGRRISLVRSFDIYDAQGKMVDNKRLLIQENAFFNKVGAYKITIEQFMRQDSLPGMVSIGMAVEQLEKKRK
jgi:gliding motility-associated lipoprotein GldH